MASARCSRSLSQAGWGDGEGSRSEPRGCQKARPAYWGHDFAEVPRGPRKGCPTHVHPPLGAGSALAPPQGGLRLSCRSA